MTGQEHANVIKQETTAKIFQLPSIAGADHGVHDKARTILEDRLQVVRDRLAGGDKAKTIENLSQAKEKVQGKLVDAEADAVALRDRIDIAGGEGSFQTKLHDSLVRARLNAEELKKQADNWERQIDCLKDEQASELSQAIRQEAMALLGEVMEERTALVEELVTFIKDRRERWHYIEAITALARGVYDRPATKLQRPIPTTPPVVVDYVEDLGDGLPATYAPMTQEELALSGG